MYNLNCLHCHSFRFDLPNLDKFQAQCSYKIVIIKRKECMHRDHSKIPFAQKGRGGGGESERRTLPIKLSFFPISKRGEVGGRWGGGSKMG